MELYIGAPAVSLSGTIIQCIHLQMSNYKDFDCENLKISV